MFLGGTPADRDPKTGRAEPLEPRVFDEAAMVDGIALYATVALHHLAPELSPRRLERSVPDRQALTRNSGHDRQALHGGSAPAVEVSPRRRRKRHDLERPHA